MTVSALAEPFSIKLPAVMKHLDVLSDAGLITRSKHGRTVNVRLSPAPLRKAAEWLRRYERFWSTALDRLAAHAERKETEARAAVMFYMPGEMNGSEWGANLPAGSAVFGGGADLPGGGRMPWTLFYVPVPVWSDGTPAEENHS